MCLSETNVGRFLNLDESMKGTASSRATPMLMLLLTTELWFFFFFSRRLEVFKGLKADTVLRNFTVFEYSQNKVSHR